MSWIRKVSLISGLVLFLFVTTHFMNHTLGIISLSAMEAGREVFIAIWRNWPATILLYSAILLHVSMAFWSVWQRRTLRMSIIEGMQVILALSIPFLMPAHVLATRGGHELFGINDSYLFEILSVWVLAPVNGWLLVVGLIVVWSHGCIGMHQWLRLQAWYNKVKLWLFALSLLLPSLALAGFASVGKQISIWAKSETWMNSAIASFKIGKSMEALVDFVYDTADLVILNTVIAVVLLMLARWVRSMLAKRGHRINIRYPDGKKVTIQPGLSILEVSRQAGIPHASVCGGRGRCSTCRVRIAEGKIDLPKAHESEKKLLARIGVSDSVRLACQLRPIKDVAVVPLLPPDINLKSGPISENYLQGSEREIAVLFADLRSFTEFSDAKLPYDVVFALNQYFRGMGQAVEAAGGHLDKFIGDGVMALFGIEVGLQQGCKQALVAASGMAQALDHLNKQLSNELNEPLRMGIGVHAGTAIVGEMGYGSAVSVTAIGNVVNAASRLETMTKEFGVQAIISDLVAEQASVDLTNYEIQQVTLRGQMEAITVYLVPNAHHLARDKEKKKRTFLSNSHTNATT